MTFWRAIFLAVLCGSSTGVFASDLTMQSGPRQTVMIELYTSEGCNSCPPAEHYVNELVDNEQLWIRYIPLAFHVDYWDYLGWRDRFASAANSQRQRTYGKVLQARAIYTPEFFVNGKEWRQGFFGGMPSATTNQVGVLNVVLKNNRLSATFQPRQRVTRSMQLHVAVLGMGMASNIRAGENAGRHTVHQFVVLAHSQVTSDKLQWQTRLPHIDMFKPRRKALVVWVSTSDNPAPLQATAGLLPQ